MTRYAIHRVLSAIPTLFIIITVAFFMMRAAPGGPFDQDRQLPAAIEKNLLAHYNMDQPLWGQYLDYLGGIVVGDFGPSFKYRDFTVKELIMTGFPASLRVGGTAMLLAIVLGIGF